MDQLKPGPKEPLMMPGPKFGQDNNGWWSKFKNQQSNIILAIIGVLIIVGGIYLYTNYRNTNQPGNPVNTEQNQNDGTVTPDQVNVSGQSANSSPATSSPKAEVTKNENDKITVKANKGAGITHLARQAAKEYLDQHADLKQNITPEHKIYIEDYIQKKTGSYGLKVGQELTFDNNLIKEAIDHASQLSEKQLQNLHKYVLLVPSLQS